MGLVHRSELYVYAVAPASLAPVPPLPGVSFLPLNADDLAGLGVDPEFRSRQLERLHRFGASYAWAGVVDGDVAHVSWLLPPAAIRRDEPRVFRPADDEWEITACETRPAFRGRGLYPAAIRYLAGVAASRGARLVLMKTTPGNTSSQSGMEKAGLHRAGSVSLIKITGIRTPFVWRRLASPDGMP
jgi:GNAT superfamily N-acetyltransferase